MNTNALKKKLLEKFFLHQGINSEYLYSVLDKLFKEKETLAISLIDSQSNIMVHSFSRLSIGMDILSEANHKIVKLILKNIKGELKDIIYYEREELHLFQPIKLGGRRTFFLYFIGLREKTNLVLLRNKIVKVSNELKGINVK